MKETSNFPYVAYMECKVGGSNKFYKIVLLKEADDTTGKEKYFVRVTYGKIGDKRPKQYVHSIHEGLPYAEATVEEIIKSKLKKGYKRIAKLEKEETEQKISKKGRFSSLIID